MKSKRKPLKIILWLVLLLAFCIGGYSLYDRGRPAPVPMKQKLFEGVIYRRVVQLIPRPMIAHVLEIDTKNANAEFLVTPPDSKGERPLNARTTSQFLDEF